MCNYEKIYQTLRNTWIQCKDWLWDKEITDIEEKLHISFPIEYRNLLSRFIPVWRSFIDRTDRRNSEIYTRLDWLFEGILFDVENNSFRYDKWWEEPEKIAEKNRKAKQMLKSVPYLIPIYWNRYISQIDWGPIFSVVQTDIIYYWSNLENYIENEFWNKESFDYSEIKVYVPFWTDIVQ